MINNNKNNKKYNIIICGAGITGLTQALLLSDLNLKIAVIDKKFPDLDINKLNLSTYDLRVSAITPTSTEVFKKLGVWQDILNLRAQPYNKMHVWDSSLNHNNNNNNNNNNINFTSRELGQPYLGHVIENKITTYCLFKKLNEIAKYKDIDLIEASLLDLNNNNLTLNNNTNNNINISADLLIAADGANSWIRNKVNIDSEYKDYEQQACVCTIETEKPLNKCAWQHFLPTGPLAFLPLNNINNNIASIVWTQYNDKSEYTKKLNNKDFEDDLAKSFDYKLGKVKLLSSRVSFPLIRQHAKTYTQEGLALIGDAAHRIHPLAGQGANIGILDAIALTEVIQKAINKSRKFYTHNWLKKYEQARWQENQNMALTMSGFNFLFSNKNNFSAKIRRLGLNIANKSTLFKNICSRTF